MTTSRHALKSHLEASLREPSEHEMQQRLPYTAQPQSRPTFSTTPSAWLDTPELHATGRGHVRQTATTLLKTSSPAPPTSEAGIHARESRVARGKRILAATALHNPEQMIWLGLFANESHAEVQRRLRADIAGLEREVQLITKRVKLPDAYKFNGVGSSSRSKDKTRRKTDPKSDERRRSSKALSPVADKVSPVAS